MVCETKPVAFLSQDSIREAGQRLLGSHDFRNFCKMDVANGVVNYIRLIVADEVDFVDKERSDSFTFGTFSTSLANDQ